MKRIIALLVTFSLCVLLSSCATLSKINTISYNEDGSELYYNGYTYVDYHNTNGKYRAEPKKDTDYWVKIATKPYSIFYVLGAVTDYYGNDVEKPDFIVNSRNINFYVREDLSINHDTELSICDTGEPYYFKISDITTNNSIAYSNDQEGRFTSVCNFFVTLKEYPGVKLWLEICEYEGKLYLQDVWDSDYYEITDAFKNDMYQLGLNTFDYH